jgi:hypothetical protein
MVGDALDEGAEAPVQIYVVRDENAPCSQSAPSSIQLKARIVFRVYTIVDKEVDLRERRKQLGEVPPARSPDVRPAVTTVVLNRSADLLF